MSAESIIEESVILKLVEPLQLSDRESRMLGSISDWQEASSRSAYIFTDKPQLT